MSEVLELDWYVREQHQVSTCDFPATRALNP